MLTFVPPREPRAPAPPEALIIRTRAWAVGFLQIGAGGVGGARGSVTATADATHEHRRLVHRRAPVEGPSDGVARWCGIRIGRCRRTACPFDVRAEEHH